MNITRRWCDWEFYLAATSVPIPCEDVKAREVSKTAASAPSPESRYEGGRRQEQRAGADGRSRRQKQAAGADGRSGWLRRRGQETRFSISRFHISHFSFFIWGFSRVPIFPFAATPSPLASA